MVGIEWLFSYKTAAMCGIAGAFDLRGKREFPAATLDSMCRAIAHRGPDDQHHLLEAGLAMGTRRLSIVDLESGRQPLSNENGTVWCSFNGELFDHSQLILDLEARGHRFSSRCDTEVWVHSYEDHGSGAFEKARGQFAVAIWDRPKRQLVLGRDRMGICPLFWTVVDGWLLWGSEIKAILASRLVSTSPDIRGLNHAFCFYASASTRTCFEGVSSLAPGCFLIAKEGTTRITRYWDLDYPDAGDELLPDDPLPLVDELEQRLRIAIRRRMRGDVPVVGYLSGGIDSTLVLTLASQEAGRPIPSFTIGLDDPSLDERDKAAHSARALGSHLTEVLVSRFEITATYPALIRHAETPVVDTSSACMVQLSAAVHGHGFKVALTGEGADEALLGYDLYKMQKVQSRTGWLVARIRHLLGGGLLVQEIDGTTRRTPVFGLSGLRTGRLGSWEVAGKGRESCYSSAMWQELAGYDPLSELDIAHPRFRSWHPLNQAAYVDYKVFVNGLLLGAAGDRSNMSSSVETRPPFLDEDLIDFCARVHPDLRLRRLTGKWLLRRVAERYLPSDVAWRRKHGFRASQFVSFLTPDRPIWVEQLMAPGSLAATGYFDPSLVAQQRRRFESGKARLLEKVSLDTGLTMVLATQLWHHIFFGGGLADLPHWEAP